ncbi:PTS system cellobiose-specific IIA component [Serratia marcescens]|nr:PTS system cellobiose-specific IIA component [Serratia marcescens]
MSELMTEVSPEFESTIMELLVFSGSARSNALMALRQARAGDFAAAA